MTKVVFMGTPEFSVPSLDALLDAGYEVVGAFTQPDRPVGRGHKLAASPVKQRALERGVPVYQFEKVRRPEGVAQLRALEPDVMVTAAFGQILTQELLDIPKRGVVNVHASLLPRHRGSAPINWCILQGEKVAGVTTMLTEAGIDTGDMLLKAETPIGEMETAGELTERLSRIGAQLLVESLDKYLSGAITPIPQDHAASTYEPMLTREMAQIDWTRPAEEIACQVRGLNPWPCAYTETESGRLKIYLARPVDRAAEETPGTVVASGAKEGLIVACGEGCLELLEIQAPNAKRMSAKAYLMGKKIDVGTRFGIAE